MPEETEVFYRVRFADRSALREWSLQVLDTLASEEGPVVSAYAAHPVVFVPTVTPESGIVYGFVSGSALRLAYEDERGVEVETVKVRLPQLPDGLSILVGNEVDATAYRQRPRQRPSQSHSPQ